MVNAQSTLERHLMTIRASRLVAAGALAVAAAAAPLVVSLTSVDSAVAGPKCLAHIGNLEDNVCAGYSNGNGINVGTPDIGVYGPNAGSLPGGGIGITTGGLLPGQTWTTPLG